MNYKESELIYNGQVGKYIPNVDERIGLDQISGSCHSLMPLCRSEMQFCR